MVMKFSKITYRLLKYVQELHLRASSAQPARSHRALRRPLAPQPVLSRLRRGGDGARSAAAATAPGARAG